MKLIAFKYGATQITERMAFQDGNEKIKLPVALLYFLIEHQGRKILVDVGCDTMPGFELFEFKKPIEILEEYGVKTNEITDVIITHSHHDHIDALRYYPQATVYIHRNELKSAEKYLSDYNRLCIFDEHKFISDNIEIRHIGGHTSGSSIVLIKADDKKYVLCGDECYTEDNLLQRKPTGSSFCLDKSKWFVKEFGKESYVPILFHAPELVSKIGFRTLIDIDI